MHGEGLSDHTNNLRDSGWNEKYRRLLQEMLLLPQLLVRGSETKSNPQFLGSKPQVRYSIRVKFSTREIGKITAAGFYSAPQGILRKPVQAHRLIVRLFLGRIWVLSTLVV